MSKDEMTVVKLSPSLEKQRKKLVEDLFHFMGSNGISHCHMQAMNGGVTLHFHVFLGVNKMDSDDE